MSVLQRNVVSERQYLTARLALANRTELMAIKHAHDNTIDYKINSHHLQICGLCSIIPVHAIQATRQSSTFTSVFCDVIFPEKYVSDAPTRSLNCAAAGTAHTHKRLNHAECKIAVGNLVCFCGPNSEEKSKRRLVWSYAKLQNGTVDKAIFIFNCFYELLFSGAYCFIGYKSRIASDKD